MNPAETSTGAYALDVVMPEDIDWMEMTPGNLIKPLRLSGDGQFALLGKMMEGAEEPRHRHIGTVNIFVISGEANINGVRPGAGAWMYEVDGAIHESFTCRTDTEVLTVGHVDFGLELLDDSDNVLGSYKVADMFALLPEDVRKVVVRD